MKNKKKGKYADEIAKLKELNAIKEVLKKGDIENAALTNTSKDSETVSDNVIDTMLDRLNIDKNSKKDLEIIESLTKKKGGSQIVKKKSVKVSSSGKGVKIKRSVHAIKQKGKGKKR